MLYVCFTHAYRQHYPVARTTTEIYSEVAFTLDHQSGEKPGVSTAGVKTNNMIGVSVLGSSINLARDSKVYKCLVTYFKLRTNADCHFENAMSSSGYAALNCLKLRDGLAAHVV